MKKETIKFLYAIIIVILSLIVADLSIGYLFDKALNKLPNYGDHLSKNNFRLYRMDSEIVILGSSRGAHHYVTSQLKDSLNHFLHKEHSVYNASLDGNFANSNSCAAEIILNRYKPKLVIYDISEGQLKVKSNQSLQSVFYKKDTIVQRYIDGMGLKNKILMKSNLFIYNQTIVRFLSSIAYPKQYDDGYIPVYGSTLDTIKKQTIKESISNDLDEYTKTNFENVLKKYSKSNVRLIIVSSPRFRPKDNNIQLAKICNKYNTPFIDLYDVQYFNKHPELFKDNVHLNDKGAHVFTALLFEQLKPYLANIK